MRPPIKKPPTPELQLAAAMAQHLLSPSKEFENARDSARGVMSDGLRALAGLDKPTKLSLPIKNEAQQPKHAPAAQTHVPPVKYDSSKQEYRAALGDRTVVDALLELHQAKRAGSKAQAPLSGFRAQIPPQVQAQPKPSLTPSMPTAGASPVYRSRGPVQPRAKSRIPKAP